SAAEIRPDAGRHQSRTSDDRRGNGDRHFLGEHSLEGVKLEFVVKPVEVLLHCASKFFQQRFRISLGDVWCAQRAEMFVEGRRIVLSEFSGEFGLVVTKVQ